MSSAETARGPKRLVDYLVDRFDISWEDITFCGVLGVIAWWYLTNLRGALTIDETYYARAGHGLLTGAPYLNPTHSFAPTAKYFIGLGTLLLGSDGTGVRLPVALFGLLVVVVSYRLGAELRSKQVGLVAAAGIGGSYFFARFATVGLLDVPLTLFFLSAVYLTVRWLRERRPRLLVLLGVAVTAATTTKAYGLVYALPPAAVVLGVLVQEQGGRDGVREFTPTVIGGIVALVVLYLPFAFVPHPPIGGTYGPPAVMAVATSLLELPVLGNYVYLFGSGFVTNVLHVGRGHAVPVSGTVYQYPPVWSYLYWMAEEGGAFYITLFCVTLVGTGYESVTKRSPTALLVGVSVLFPLTFLSLLTVKFPRYILPLFPLVVVVGLSYLCRWLDGRLRFSALTRTDRTRLQDIVVVVGVVVMLGVVPPAAPIAQSIDEPLRTDSRYDDAAAYVEAYAADHEGEQLVLTYHRVTFQYYLGEEVAVRTVPLKAAQVAANDSHVRRLRQLLERGEVDLVVDVENNTRLRDTTVGQCIRTHGTPVRRFPLSPTDDVLVVYEMPDSPVAC